MTMILALVRPVPESIARCELTHLERVPIDHGIASLQHGQYVEALRSLGCVVRELPKLAHLPDSVFVEDAAIVLDEIAVITRPGAESRRDEVFSVADALREYRKLEFIEAPGTLDGGDVIVTGRNVFVGRSTRTNEEAIQQLSEIATSFGYQVRPVSFRGCLHLKSAVTSLSARTVLLNPQWVERETFAGMTIVEVHRDEPYAANALEIDGSLLFPTSYPRTLAHLRGGGYDIRAVDASELAKAEGALTCCSLIVKVKVPTAVHKSSGPTKMRPASCLQPTVYCLLSRHSDPPEHSSTLRFCRESGRQSQSFYG